MDKKHPSHISQNIHCVSDKQKAELKKAFRGTLLFDFPMSKITSLKIGGLAEIMAEPAGYNDLKRLIKTASETGIRIKIIGNASNIIVSDYGIPGIIIRLCSDAF